MCLTLCQGLRVAVPRQRVRAQGALFFPLPTALPHVLAPALLSGQLRHVRLAVACDRALPVPAVSSIVLQLSNLSSASSQSFAHVREPRTRPHFWTS